MRSGWIKRFGIGALVFVVTGGVVELVADLRSRRLRAERSALGDRLYTEVRGQGDPVVFLAGLPATTRYWQGAFDPLAATNRLIFVDALGFGRSPLPDVEYTLEDHLGALRRTLVGQGATHRVTFVAHSFGTLLAAYYAARHPAEVERLFLLGTPVFADEEEARAHLRHTSPTVGVFTLNPLLARAMCKLHEAAYSRALVRIVPLFAPDTPPVVVQEGLLHTWESFDGTLRNVVLTQPIARPLAGLGPKVTFVHGRAERTTSLARIRALAGAIGAQVLETPDDHLSYPTRSAGRILAALRADSRDPRPERPTG